MSFHKRTVSPSVTAIVTDQILNQAGVIAYRVVDSKLQVLLVTSRDTGRWIIPKGNVRPGLTPSRAAEKEAFEEAGIKGVIAGVSPLGVYTYSKRLESGETRPATVEVYILRVKQQSKKWPEKGERKLAWLSAKKAVRVVQEPGVVPLLVRLIALEDSLIEPARKSGAKPVAAIGA